MAPPVTYSAPAPKTKNVFYSGTQTLKMGQPLCYNHDAGTAEQVDYDRLYEVEDPSTSNNLAFAGVVHESSAGETGPCPIVIVEPGSLYPVYTDQNCTINSTLITAQAGAATPIFYKAGFLGRGTAIAKQSLDCSSGKAVLAYLYDGEESGLVEKVTPANGVMTVMVGGTTYFPATDITVGNATYTLADGTYVGQRKAFWCEGTMSTSDIVITVTTPMPVGAYPFTAPAAAFNTFTMDAAAEYLIGEWKGKAWELRGEVGTTA